MTRSASPPARPSAHAGSGRRRRTARLAKAAFGVALAAAGGACAALDVTPPAGFDLTGEWTLDADASDPTPDMRAIRRRADRRFERKKSEGATAAAAFMLQDFPVLAATRLSIEQNADSMGVHYDEHTYRDVSWGEREWDFWIIRAGWQDGALVVSSARGATRGTETYVLEAGGDRLRVRVRVETDGEHLEAARVYQRA